MCIFATESKVSDIGHQLECIMGYVQMVYFHQLSVCNRISQQYIRFISKDLVKLVKGVFIVR